MFSFLCLLAGRFLFLLPPSLKGTDNQGTIKGSTLNKWIFLLSNVALHCCNIDDSLHCWHTIVLQLSGPQLFCVFWVSSPERRLEHSINGQYHKLNSKMLFVIQSKSCPLTAVLRKFNWMTCNGDNRKMKSLCYDSTKFHLLSEKIKWKLMHCQVDVGYLHSQFGTGRVWMWMNNSDY